MTGDTVRIYMDGTLVAKKKFLHKALDIARQFNYIGRSNWAELNADALFDEFRLYNKALTQEEIITHTCQYAKKQRT